MATSPIAPTGDLSSSAAGRLKLDDLLRVLLTELTHQNPFKPVDNKDFMGQIAQFASLDSSQRVSQGVEQLLTLQAINQSVGLIGKTVSATTDGGTIRGKVTAMTLTNGLPRVTLDSNGQITTGIAIGQIETVENAP